MENFIIEKNYPITFREEDARLLGGYLKNRSSVMLVGMRRVGISNFLRFFLYHKDISSTYINDGKRHVFISVNLDDLVERDIYPFWTLTLKRIVDKIKILDLPDPVRREIDELFSSSVQSQDLFLTIDNVRRALLLLVEQDYLPTLFLLRFDRLKDVATPGFFTNLQGLNDALHHKLSFVFTSYRKMNELAPTVFDKASLSIFLQDMFVKPAKKEDTQIIYNTYKEHYKVKLSFQMEQDLFATVDGYVQYLQLALVVLQEQKGKVENKEALINLLVKDERVGLQSEELWESLTTAEKNVLLDISRKGFASEEERQKGRYLWDTGFLTREKKLRLFSPLFAQFVQEQQKTGIETIGPVDFTKKELALFRLLQLRLNEICEREEIIDTVWPEVESLGVSDWAIDRLVARVRQKLRLQKDPFEIQTVKTRGYKLVPSAQKV